MTGTCDCKEGWTGADCSEDMDECKNGFISCNESIHQVCVNTKGSAHCECRYGGSDISNCVGKWFIYRNTLKSTLRWYGTAQCCDVLFI